MDGKEDGRIVYQEWSVRGEREWGGEYKYGRERDTVLYTGKGEGREGMERTRKKRMRGKRMNGKEESGVEECE